MHIINIPRSGRFIKQQTKPASRLEHNRSRSGFSNTALPPLNLPGTHLTLLPILPRLEIPSPMILPLRPKEWKTAER